MNIEELIKLNNSGYTQREMAKILNVNRTTIQRHLKKLELSTPNYHNRLKFDNTVFDNINTEEKAYWLGFLYADGSVSSTSNNVEISLKCTRKKAKFVLEKLYSNSSIYLQRKYDRFAVLNRKI